MLRRPVAAGLVASLLALTGCTTAVSGASTRPDERAPVSTTTPTTAFVAAAVVDEPSALVRALESTWARTAGSSCLMVADGPKVIFERNQDAALVPASTMKLLTATAVLARISPESRLTTPVLAVGPPDAAGVVHGDLWLVGGGNPVLGTLPYRDHFRRQPRLVDAAEVLADRVVAAGVRHVAGRVMGDDGRHERTRYVPSWPARYATDDQTGPLSALTLNDGFERWDPDTEPFADPAAGAAGVFTELLRQRGVTVDGVPGSGAFPAGAVELASMASPTIAELVAQMLLDSDNTTAELLLRELGLQVLGEGTTDAGRRVVVDTLTRLGLPMEGVRVMDGSGLDPENRVTCRLLVAILTSSPSRGAVDAGLPVAAQTGTLYKRFLATPVAGHLRAKTGSIRATSTLAGHADAADGRTLTFAYLQTNVGPGQGQELQDALGHDLVLHRP